MNEKFIIVLGIFICAIFYFGVDYLLSLNSPVAFSIAGLIIIIWLILMFTTRKK
ncbi:Uncharacterized protein BCF24048_04982 [Bacillus cereus]|uniref:hypothetical protein n=1 Tax=Lysinibacillus sp. GbtcB16 TaxID=2824761 RepID=UPI000863F061|nr:hypothetical protein [Lysinibacillus sp. GbtcB16]SCN01530.1 Uncharacterized protein BCF24048_04982 [Bacillus cereus]